MALLDRMIPDELQECRGICGNKRPNHLEILILDLMIPNFEEPEEPIRSMQSQQSRIARCHRGCGNLATRGVVMGTPQGCFIHYIVSTSYYIQSDRVAGIFPLIVDHYPPTDHELTIIANSI